MKTVVVRRHKTASSVPEPVPAPVPDQAEQRRRRRSHMRLTYDRNFDLGKEIEAITKPLATRVAAEPAPAVYFYDVTELVVSVHKAVVMTIGDLLAARDARSRTMHLKDLAERDRAIQLLVARQPRPVCPQVDAADLASGRWADSLVELVTPYTGPLSDFLANALPPGAVRAVSVSERTENALRGIDSAANALERRLHAVASDRAQCAPRTSSVDAGAAELRRLGVTP